MELKKRFKVILVVSGSVLDLNVHGINSKQDSQIHCHGATGVGTPWFSIVQRDVHLVSVSERRQPFPRLAFEPAPRSGQS